MVISNSIKAVVWGLVFLGSFLAVPHAGANDAADSMTCQGESGSCKWNDQPNYIEDAEQPQGTEATPASTAASTIHSDSTAASDDSSSTSSDANPGHHSDDSQLLLAPSDQAVAPEGDTALTATAGPSVDTQPNSSSPAATSEDAAEAATAVNVSNGVFGSDAAVAVPAPATDGVPLAAAPSTVAASDAIASAQPDAAAAPPASVEAAEPLLPLATTEKPVATADSPLEELRSLLQQARQAVARLEAEVTRQERRLAAATTAAAARGGGAATAAEPAVAAATAAALRSLGIDAGGASVAARQALREALQQVLREWGPAAATSGSVVGGGGQVAASGAGVAEEDWFGRHFAVRSAARLAPPSSSPPPAEGDAAAPSEPGTVAAPPPAATPAAVVTCAFPYELPHPDAAASGGGALQYIVAGDAAGTLHILRPADGAVLASLPTGTDSAVTACSAFFIRRYESTVVTGHGNGQTRSFAVVLQDAEDAAAAASAAAAAAAAPAGAGEPAAAAEPPPPAAASPSPSRQRQQRQRVTTRGTASSKLVVQSVRLRHVVESMPSGALPWAAVEELPMAASGGGTAAAAAAADGDAAPAVAAAPGAGGESPDYKGPPAPIMHILPYRLGHKPTGRRHVLVLDRAGNVRLERENGTLRFWARTNRTQMAVRFVGTHLVMLSAYHATLLNTLQPRPPRAYPCHHLNGTRLVAASFDGHRPFRGYGINGRGELLSMVTPHEGGLTTCKVHRATPLPWLRPELLTDPWARHSLSLTPLRGYLLLTHGSGRVLFNVTGVVRTGIPALTSVADDTIADVAGAAAPPATATIAADIADATSPPPSAPSTQPSPLIGGMLPPPPVVAVGPGSQVLVLVLPPPPPADAVATEATEAGAISAGDATTAPGTAVGASLVVVLDSRMPRPPVSGGASKIWSQPVFVAAMLLVGLYQFWRMSNARMKHRAGPSATRGIRARRAAYGAGYGGNSYDDAAEYMYGESRMPPLQPRSALRRGRSDRPMGRTVTYEDGDY